MQSNLRRKALLLALLPLLSAVPACADKEILPPPALQLSAVDVRAANTVKPVPHVEALTDDAVAASDSVAIELWGETVSRAWGRICRTMAGQGVAVVCPVSAGE